MGTLSYGKKVTLNDGTSGKIVGKHKAEGYEEMSPKPYLLKIDLGNGHYVHKYSFDVAY